MTSLISDDSDFFYDCVYKQVPGAQVRLKITHLSSPCMHGLVTVSRTHRLYNFHLQLLLVQSTYLELFIKTSMYIL